MSWRHIIETLAVPGPGGMMAQVHLKDFDQEFVNEVGAWIHEREPLTSCDADRGLWVIHVARQCKVRAYGGVPSDLMCGLERLEQVCLAAGARGNWWSDQQRWNTRFAIDQ